MANQFVLTAQIALQAPTNARQTLNQIQRQLHGVNVSVNLNSNPAQIKSLNQQLNSVNQSAKAASNSVSELGKTIGAAARRFGAISLATGTFLGLTRAIKGSISDAIEFERQMVVLSQTTEKSVRELGDLYREVTRLSTGLGVSSDGLIKTSIVLAQAGLEARKAKGALEVLAKTQLAASFDDIQSTTEGAIAILAQFRREAAGAGGDIKFLETSLEAINQVSKKYAVESSDLIAVIRRSGGAFEAAGGSLNELLALFTSVRATTRESAETISTGLRTIFTRIQRVDTIKQLKELGIALQDAEGKFVGPFEAIKRISEGLSSLDPRDFRFAQIVEELGGFRQIGKVIPLIKQFALAQEALNTAQGASGSLSKDAETAQLSLANKIVKVKEEFQALVREFTQGEGFQSVARGALEFARALIRIADSIEPLLPLIASLGAIQVGRGLASALGAFSGFTRKNSGGRIMAFASGGMVPGTGNRDTVPAMLSPGEFVIRKSSVKKIGAENLQKLNKGGSVRNKKNKAFVFDFDDTLGETEAVVGGGANPYQNFRGAAAAKFVDEGHGTRYAAMAKKRFEKGFDIHVLTARPQEQETVDAIQRFMQKFVGGPAKSVIGVADMFKGEREPGKRPGTTRQLSTASKKAKVLRQFASQYEQIVFADDNMENYLAGKELEKEGLRVKSVLAKKAFGGAISKYWFGGEADANVRYSFTRPDKKGNQKFDIEKAEKMREKMLKGLPSGIADRVRGASMSMGQLEKGTRGQYSALKNAITFDTESASLYTAKHEVAHAIDRAKMFHDLEEKRGSFDAGTFSGMMEELEQSNKFSSTRHGFANIIATLLKRSYIKARMPVSDYRESEKELFADALSKVPSKVRAILVNSSDQTIGAKALMDYWAKKPGPIPGLANISPDEIRPYLPMDRKAFGGIAKKFAMGGMVGGGIKNENEVGALILQPGKDVNSVPIEVTRQDIIDKANIQKKDIDFASFPKTKRYMLERSGIKDDIFLGRLNEGISTGLTQAIQAASNSVTDMLGLARIETDPQKTKKLSDSINPGARGTIFEEVIANISRNSGGEPFDKRNDPTAPFDFIGDIGKAKGLFANQKAATTTYKDAKASLEIAKPGDFIKKTANQTVKEADLTAEAVQKQEEQDNKIKNLRGTTFVGNTKELANLFGVPESSVQGGKRKEFFKKKNLTVEETQIQNKGIEYKFFAKGGAAPSDTVPALLTPGEFVVKKSTAQKIGYGALDRMNKTGEVQGYANGGVVEMAKGGSQNSAKAKYKAQRSAERKQVTLAQQGLLFTPEDQIDYTKLGGAQRQAPKTSGQGGESEVRAAGSILPGTGQGAASPALAAARLSTERVIELGKKAEELGLDYQAGAVLEKKYLQQRKLGLSREEAYQKAQEAAIKNLENRKKKEDTKTEDKKSVSIDAEAIQKVAQSAQNFIYLAGSAATLASQFSSMDDAAKEAITQTIAFGAVLTGAIGTVTDFGINIAKALPAGAKNSIKGGLGALAPIIMNPLTLIIGAVVLAIGAVIYGMKAYQKALAEQAKKQAQQIASDIEQGKKSISAKEEYIRLETEAATRLIASYWLSSGAIKNEIDARKEAATSYIDTIINLRNLDEQLKAIDADKSLSPLQIASKKIDAQFSASSNSAQQLGESASALAKIFAETGTINLKGVENKFGKDSNIFEVGSRASETFSKNIEALTSGIAANLSNLQTIFEESSKNFSFKTGPGSKSAFDQLLEGSSDFSNAFNKSKEGVRRDAMAMAKAMLTAGKSTNETVETLFKLEKAQIDNEKTMRKMAEANAKAAQSAILLNQALRESAQSAFITANLRNTISKIDDVGKSLSVNLGSINSIIQQEFSTFTLPEIQGLDNLSNIINFDKFKIDLNNIASNFGTFGKKAANEISGVAQVLTNSRSLLGREFVGVGDDAGSEAKKAIEDVLAPLKGVGGSIGALVARAKGDLEKAASGGGEQGAVVTQSEIENALSPLKDFVNQNTELFKSFAEQQSILINVYGEHIKALQDSFSREADLREKFTQTQATGAERMAQAKGKPLTFEQKDAFRVRAAQQRLSTTGVGVKATDIRGLSAESLSLQKQLQELNKKVKIAKDQQDIKSLKSLNFEQGVLTSKLKETTSALKNLSDQSAKASDILADIEKERGKRELGLKTISDLVVGSREERQGILKSFAGLQMVGQTGTLQGLDAETRKSVFGLLDQLGSVDESFADFKKSLILSDAMQMGLDPRIAATLANATPKEEQLKNALEQTTAQELMATQALIGQEEQNREALVENTKSLNNLIDALPVRMAQAIQQSYAQFENQRIQKQKVEQELRRRDTIAANQIKQRQLAEENDYNLRIAAAKDNLVFIINQMATDIAAAKPKVSSSSSQQTFLSSPPTIPFTGRAKGGIIYANRGGAMKPKGTDTVPAMLTPGEFVIRKSSVDKYGTDMMEDINNGKYLANGGSVDWQAFERKNSQKVNIANAIKNSANTNDVLAQVQEYRNAQLEPYRKQQEEKKAKEQQRIAQEKQKREQEAIKKQKEREQQAIREQQEPRLRREEWIKESKERAMRREQEDAKEKIEKERQYRIYQRQQREIPRQQQLKQNLLRNQQFSGSYSGGYGVNNVLGTLMGGVSAQQQLSPRQLQLQNYNRMRGAEGLPIPQPVRPRMDMTGYGNVYNPMNARGGSSANINQSMVGFNDFLKQLENISKVLNGMNMQHSVETSGMINMNSAEVAEAVRRSVEEFVIAEVQRVLRQPNGFRAGNSSPR